MSRKWVRTTFLVLGFWGIVSYVGQVTERYPSD